MDKRPKSKFGHKSNVHQDGDLKTHPEEPGLKPDSGRQRRA
jgi:hypothetical protein